MLYNGSVKKKLNLCITEGKNLTKRLIVRLKVKISKQPLSRARKDGAFILKTPPGNDRATTGFHFHTKKHHKSTEYLSNLIS